MKEKWEPAGRKEKKTGLHRGGGSMIVTVGVLSRALTTTGHQQPTHTRAHARTHTRTHRTPPYIKQELRKYFPVQHGDAN